MARIKTQAVYQDGILKPQKKLELPDKTTVNIEITPVDYSGVEISFGTLKGVWSHLSDRDLQLVEREIADLRERYSGKFDTY